MNTKDNVNTVFLMELETVYLRGYFEDWEDEECNYTVTSNPERAYQLSDSEDVSGSMNAGFN